MDIISQSPRLLAALERANRVARADAPVLIVGETGTGKEVFASHLHNVSSRVTKPFAAISLAALPTDLVESELFGHTKGAFTGASADRGGVFEAAHSGTLFIDDVDDVSPAIQVKLLRVLETGTVQRLGSHTTISSDVRLITASKQRLEPLVEQGRFRPDFFYRIACCQIELPPLRERPEDIPILLAHFLARFSGEKPPPTPMPDAAEALSRYRWPGNIRQLRNVAHQLAVLCDGFITLADLPPEITPPESANEVVDNCLTCMGSRRLDLDEALGCLEITVLRRALTDARGNASRAARSVGLSLSTFRDRVTRHRLSTR